MTKILFEFRPDFLYSMLRINKAQVERGESRGMRLSYKGREIGRITAMMLLAGSVLSVSGCATMNQGNGLPHKTAAQLIKEGDAKASAGDNEGAVALLHQASRENPVDPTPWLHVAQIRFHSNDYVDALVAAEEVISRDQSNQQGNSIALVSSLRLAEQSLGELRGSADLEGSMRDRAQQLAQQLRETLGEGVLAPQSAPHRSHYSSHHVATSHSVSKSSTASSSSTSATASAAKSPDAPAASQPASSASSSDSAKKDDGSLNPFQTLQQLPQQ